ncbi:MAG: hypothetical protein ACREQ7_05355 [Candidatus Binatia bacterium]
MPAVGAARAKYSQLTSDWNKVKGTLALITSLREFLRDRVTVEQAEKEIKRSLENREERFLELIRTRVYECPGSPYLTLLKFSGCEFSDLRAHIHGHGLENTLELLARAGVYLSSDEFKGKKEVVRGCQSFRVSPRDFESPDLFPLYAGQSSGTNNQPVRFFVHTNYLATRALSACVFFSAHNLFSHSHAAYDSILPGAGGVNNLLINSKLGISTDRWFARKIPVRTRLDGLYHYLMTYLIVLCGKSFGPGFPKPEFVELTDIHRIVHWVEAQRRAGKHCCITAPASNAVRIAREAGEMGASLRGTKFITGGEPLTGSKRAAIERVGASVTLRYAYGGGLNAGYGCGNPIHIDEIHVNQNMVALINHPMPLSDNIPSIHPLLCTTLYPSTRLLLNVANGDYAALERRDCGCALEKAGLTLHLHQIRSFEKFTSEGMNYFYGDLFELFEKTLPSEFGGGPGDYQLVEEEDGNAQTRLTLVVHPAAGELDECKVLARVRDAFSNGSRGNRFMAAVWESAGTFRVRREVPYASPRGKILPLHIARAKA